jgi:hypothetical protein
MNLGKVTRGLTTVLCIGFTSMVKKLLTSFNKNGIKINNVIPNIRGITGIFFNTLNVRSLKLKCYLNNIAENITEHYRNIVFERLKRNDTILWELYRIRIYKCAFLYTKFLH